jgi:hypothetical protein
MSVVEKPDQAELGDRTTMWSVTKGECGTFEVVDTTDDDLQDEFADGVVYGQFPSRAEALQAYIEDMVAAMRDAKIGIKAARRLLRRELKRKPHDG